MLSVVNPTTGSFAAPLLYTCMPDSTIFSLPQERSIREILDPEGENARLAMFVSSIQASLEFEDDWGMADAPALNAWRERLQWAERAYRTHLDDASPAAQQAARQGLGLVRARLMGLEAALIEMEAEQDR
jgi:hypothetical protein